MVLQHSLPICLTFVPCAGMLMLDLPPREVESWYLTDRNAVKLTSIREQEGTRLHGLLLCLQKHTNHFSKQSRISALEGLALALYPQSSWKVVQLQASLALSAQRGVTPVKLCCHPAPQHM